MNLFIPYSVSQDEVAVYDGFTQVFQAARPLRGGIRESSRLMDHPIESGAAVTDHKVIRPVEIDLACLLEASSYRDTYAEIRRHFRESTFLTVQTRSATYDNMVIEHLPHEETPDLSGTISVDLRLKEVIVITAEYSELPVETVRDPSQSSTVRSGEVRPQQEV